ncbi:hypothetical protein BLNAU_23793 [Blattamonas nauphoetae]|uniref:Transposase n=1 Tax=Blattamonas nauphoetae TaxID=2049346 RepID=A0ABQ9WP79_9EUKA|nr:hypothetical protein BLNAU_23793 [Blattamonas nauphoetae]
MLSAATHCRKPERYLNREIPGTETGKKSVSNVMICVLKPSSSPRFVLFCGTKELAQRLVLPIHSIHHNRFWMVDGFCCVSQAALRGDSVMLNDDGREATATTSTRQQRDIAEKLT